MSATQTPVVRNVNVKAGETKRINLPNGASFLVSGDGSVVVDSRNEPAAVIETPVVEEPEVVEEPAAAAPAETPIRRRRRKAADKPAESAPAESNSKAKASARKRGASSSTDSEADSNWTSMVHQEDKFKGLAVFETKKGLKDVAILGKGDKKYKIGFLNETKKGKGYVWKKNVFFVDLDDPRLSNIEYWG